jgi:hypothetical protein
MPPYLIHILPPLQTLPALTPSRWRRNFTVTQRSRGIFRCQRPHKDKAPKLTGLWSRVQTVRLLRTDYGRRP